MAHLHEIRDNDTHFVIDPDSRNLTNNTGMQIIVMQYDHKSERVTFELPMIVEGHDMSKSDLVQVMYENISTGTSAKNRVIISGAQEIVDFAPAEDDPNILVGSWLITQETTQLAGTIRFQIRFICHGVEDSEGEIPEELVYGWRTNLCTAFTVLPSLDTINEVVVAAPDLFIELDRRMDQVERNGVSDERLSNAVETYLVENPPIREEHMEQVRTEIINFVSSLVDGSKVRY